MSIRTRSCAIVFCLALVCSLSIVPAKTTEVDVANVNPAWSLRFDNPIEWQRVTPMGHLLVSTATGLHGIEPDNGQVVWTRTDLGQLVEDFYEVIPGTPFVVISDETVPRRVVVLDSIEGRVIFDSKQAGIREVVGKNILFRRGALLIHGIAKEGEDPVMALFDIATGERHWTNDSIFVRRKPIQTRGAQRPQGKFFKFMDKMNRAASGPEPPAPPPEPADQIESYPVELGEDAFLLASNRGLFRLDSSTGEVAWKISMFSTGSHVFLSPTRADMLVVGHRYTHTVDGVVQNVTSHYRAYHVSDGKEIWKEPVTLNGGVNDVIFHERGLVLSPKTSSGKIKLVDYETGRSLWGKKGKGIKINGGIVDHIVIGNEIILTTGFDSAWTKKGTEYFLNILDVDKAALRFKSPHKVKGRMLATEVLPKGILYITTSEMNILDRVSGKPLHKSVISDGSLITATAGDRVYAFSSKDRSLYVLDKTRGSLDRLSEAPVKLGDGEIPFSLEVGDSQITLVSNQNIAVFDPAGSLKFHSYHPAPRRSGLMRALLIANSVRAGIASAATGVYSGAFAAAAADQKPGSVGNTLTAGVAEGYGEMAVGYGSLSKQYAAAARERFKASTNAADFVFMMVQLPNRRFGLARVSKTDGEIVALVDMHKDKQPSYQVDSISNRIYYRLQPTELVGYRFR